MEEVLVVVEVAVVVTVHGEGSGSRIRGGARAITSMLSIKKPDVIAKTLTLSVVGRLPLCLGTLA